jgi:hypothetical protein
VSGRTAPAPRVRGHHTTRVVRGAVQAAVSAVHRSRPTIAASAGEQAVWWHRTAGALALLADNEADPARADAARADAATARRLADGMAQAHTAHVVEPEPDVVELRDAAEVDVLEVAL